MKQYPWMKIPPSLILQLTGLVVCDYVSIIGVDIDAEVNAPMNRPTVSIEDACKRVIDEKYAQVCHE